MLGRERLQRAGPHQAHHFLKTDDVRLEARDLVADQAQPVRPRARAIPNVERDDAENWLWHGEVSRQ
jgi:hypothetical protein